MTIQELAKQLGAIALEFLDESQEIFYVAGIEDAGPGAVTFIANPHYERFLAVTKATAVIVGAHIAAPTAESGRCPTLIRVARPYEAFATALELFRPAEKEHATGIHSAAVVESDATVDPTASIGPLAYLGHRTTIGANARIAPGAIIEHDCTIGANSTILPNAVVCYGTIIGEHVVIGPGAVIGFDGFGYVPMGDGTYRKIPQVGKVVIEDNVEIGANTTIDRATIAETRIRSGVKLDNLIQIAHNVELGENTVIAALTGISGSTKLGKSNVIAGQVGMVGHITTTDHVIIGAQSGVSKSISKSGTYFGSPIKNHRDALKLEGALRSLPELMERVRQLEHLVNLQEEN